MRTLLISLIIGSLATCAGAQAIHRGSIWLEGPDGPLQANTTYTIEGWARWESPIFINGQSGMAGFGLDVINTSGSLTQVIGVSNYQVGDWAARFASVPAIVGTDLLWISGGQLAALINPVEPEFDLSNPIMLFRFDFTTGGGPIEHIAFAPMNPNPNGGLSFYPDYRDGASIIAPNDPDTELHLLGWEYFVPSPAVFAGLGFGAMLASARRKR